MLRWFETRLDPYPNEIPRQPPRRFWSFCLHYMGGTKRWLALMALTAGVIGFLEILMFAFMGSIIDWLSGADKETFFQTEGNRLILMSVVVLVVFPIFAIANTLVIHQTLAGNFPQRIRWMAHRYLLRQSMSFFQDEFAGRIATKLMQTALAVREVVMKLLDILLYVVIYFLGAVVLIASSDWRLVLPLVMWFAIYLGLLRYFVPRLGKVAQAQADARSTMTGRIVDSYTNISTVKLFSHSAREEAYAHDALEEFLVTVRQQMRLGTWLEGTIDILNTLLLFSITALGLLLWQQSVIGAGAVAIGIAIAIRLQGMSHWIMWEMSALFENIGTVRDGINTLALPALVHDAPGARELEVSDGAIHFENITFKYDRGSANDQPPVAGVDNTRDIVVIDGFDLAIKPGEKIGLVGRSGAGKSTLVSLILRFYDLGEGRITIDGTDISKVTQESLRGAIGVVSQDTSLLHRSVRQNIKYGRPDASEEEMIRAAKLAEAHEFILDLEDAKGNRGYDAQVGERGVKLSGGQRQRIAISRVLLKDAPILVLDEATSALDSEVEAAIQGQFELLMENKTVLAIAHRLSTIAAMDRLIVLDEGKIVEQGTHAELIALKGTYAQLWARQSGGFLDLDEGEQGASKTG